MRVSCSSLSMCTTTMRSADQFFVYCTGMIEYLFLDLEFDTRDHRWNGRKTKHIDPEAMLHLCIILSQGATKGHVALPGLPSHGHPPPSIIDNTRTAFPNMAKHIVDLVGKSPDLVHESTSPDLDFILYFSDGATKERQRTK